MPTEWIEGIIGWIVRHAPDQLPFLQHHFMVSGLFAVTLFSLICGSVGSLVVGNRMAFFSDAMAHCAFAGVALGLLLSLFLPPAAVGWFGQFGVPIVMVLFGLLVGLAIAFVREKTGLASDTVIGIFFAGAIGFGAVLLKPLSQRGYFDLEAFLFGNPLFVSPTDLLMLMGLLVVTTVTLLFLYNHLVFASFNPSLARSRRIRVRLANYLFIVLLALIVNLCLRIVGALLINALLIVPAATASYLARNTRQLFWMTTSTCLLVGVGGLVLSWEIEAGLGFEVGVAGMIVVLSVFLFFIAMLIGPWLQRRPA
jgi:zinc transport system permease protein